MARRSAQDAAQTREAILAAARTVFAEAGFSDAATREIARRAGVTEGALFHHFAGKSALFLEVMVSLQEEQAEYCRQVSRGGEPMAAFLAGCRAALEFGQRHDFLRIVMIEGPVVLGKSEWSRVDSGVGLATLEKGLGNLEPSASAAAIKPMAVMVMGALNETLLALGRGEPGVELETSLALLERLLRAWAGR